MWIDVRHGELFQAPKSNIRRISDVENACRFIDLLTNKILASQIHHRATVLGLWLARRHWVLLTVMNSSPFLAQNCISFSTLAPHALGSSLRCRLASISPPHFNFALIL